MGKLVTINGLNDEELLSGILSDEIIKTNSLSSEQINLVDLAMKNYYNPVINYFNSLDNRVKGLLNKKWSFCFEYFPDRQPANIEYDRVPKNQLVLTAINKAGKYDFNIEELDEYARLLNVDMIPIIYQGKLTETMKEAIKYFINTSEKDLEYIFGEKSFAYFFYKILNPSIKNSFLMNTDDFQQNVEKLIIKTNSNDMNFELLNPLYHRMSESNDTDFVEIYNR